jgi:cell division protein FtsB
MSRSASQSISVIVRTYAPVRRSVAIAAVVLLGAFALYVIYELGRYDAGYDRLAVAQQRAELEAALEHLKQDNHELNLRLAEIDTQRIGWAREQAEVSRTIGDLQAQVARQSQDLAFYRGVGAQSATAPLGVSIQQLRIGATPQAAHFRVHLTLVRSVRADDVVNGSALLRVDGEAQGREESVGLAALTGGSQRELRYSFRYYQNLDQEITIPEGLRPERLSIEVRSTRKGIAPLSQTFMWNVDAS